MTEVKTVPQILRALEDRGMDASGLRPVGVRPALSSYLRDLWNRRHFIWMDSRHRVATKHRGNRLGSAWLVLRPLLDAFLYFVIFGLILQASRGIDNFAAYIIIGVLMFRSTMHSVTQGPGTLRSGKSMIRAFSFPRASLPISAEIRDALQMCYTIVVMLVMIMVIPPMGSGGDEWLLPGEKPDLVWLMILPIFALQFALNTGISFVMARVGFTLPDVSQLMAFVSRFLMYGSGIIFPIDNYLDHPLVRAVVDVNPIYQMVHMYRQVLIDGSLPAAHSWWVLGIWAGGLLIGGFLYFWAGEATYGDER